MVTACYSRIRSLEDVSDVLGMAEAAFEAQGLLLVQKTGRLAYLRALSQFPEPSPPCVASYPDSLTQLVDSVLVIDNSFERQVIPKILAFAGRMYDRPVFLDCLTSLQSQSSFDISCLDAHLTNIDGVKLLILTRILDNCSTERMAPFIAQQCLSRFRKVGALGMAKAFSSKLGMDCSAKYQLGKLHAAYGDLQSSIKIFSSLACSGDSIAPKALRRTALLILELKAPELESVIPLLDSTFAKSFALDASSLQVFVEEMLYNALQQQQPLIKCSRDLGDLHMLILDETLMELCASRPVFWIRSEVKAIEALDGHVSQKKVVDVWSLLILNLKN